ncbi:YgaP-like transmembrane domain [Aestuariivivens sediminis]|uniref:YgaP-like transmembrane domain n=1 Tax=Aestuariivivens sediminis TaxID=2913557 RepID=UPI001F58504A|nr:YgaP-like transmembrane domain [Aestuariivivens sediminis]
MGTNRTHTKVRLHDAIVGILYGLSVILAVTLNIQWLYVAGAVALLQIISPVTKFCPVYFILNKMMPDSEPLQNGK